MYKHHIWYVYIAVLGAPADNITRWRVFKNPRVIDTSLLPPPILPPKEEGEGETAGDADNTDLNTPNNKSTNNKDKKKKDDKNKKDGKTTISSRASDMFRTLTFSSNKK